MANPLLLRCVGDIQFSTGHRAQVSLLLDILAKCFNLRTLLLEVGNSVVQNQISEMFQSSGQLSGKVTVEVQAPLPFLTSAQLGTHATALLLPSLLRQAPNLVHLTSHSPSYQLSHHIRDTIDCGKGLQHLMLVGEDAAGGLGMSQNTNVGIGLRALHAYPDYSLPSVVDRTTRLRRLDIRTVDNGSPEEVQWSDLITNCNDAFARPGAYFIRELSIPRRFLRTASRGGPAALLQIATKKTPLFELQVDLSDDSSPAVVHRALNVLMASLKDHGSCLRRLKRLVVILSFSNMPGPWQTAADIVHLPKELLEIARKRRICFWIMDDNYSIPKSGYFDPASPIALANIH